MDVLVSINRHVALNASVCVCDGVAAAAAAAVYLGA